MLRYCGWLVIFLAWVACARPTPVLCLAARDAKGQGLTHIEATALAAYREQGFDLQFDYYESVSAEKLLRYPVVVGMLAQLHQGTSVFAGSFGPALRSYLEQGGGFIFFSGPSYYGGSDFDRMQNPFLKTFGAELLREVPRLDSAETKVPRILAFRYLHTEDVRRTKWTKGCDGFYLPLDWSDSYLRTHTMKLSPEWDVLATAGKNVPSFRYEGLLRKAREPGSYEGSVPVLAVRAAGKGHFALFTTSSGYFIWEAGHPAFGDGFVLKNGGLSLMCGLLCEMARRYPLPVTAELSPPAAAKRAEMPVFATRRSWYDYILKVRTPAGFGLVKYINCGGLGDLPYSDARGAGYEPEAAGHLFRFPSKDMFHPTAACARGFSTKPLVYRFGGLPDGEYKLGVLLWSCNDDVARDVRVRGGGLDEVFALPKLSDEQAPEFAVRPVTVTNGTLRLEFVREDAKSNSAVCELWLFRKGAPGVSADALAAQSESPEAGYEAEFPKLKSFKGIIGLRSEQDGGFSPAAAAQALKAGGYDFGVFTDPVTRHTDASYGALKKACEAATDGTVALFPGIAFTGTGRTGAAISAYVFQPLSVLPSAEALAGPSGPLFWKFFGGAFSGGRNSAPTLSTPSRNELSPFFQRFWRGFDVVDCGPDGRVEVNSARMYIDLLVGGYGPQPRAAGIYRSAESLHPLWTTRFLARSREAIVSEPHRSYVSSGPEITAFQMADEGFNGYGMGGGLVFGEPRWAVVNIAAAHTAAIARVTLFFNRDVVRRWQPGTTAFRTEEVLRIADGGEYWLRVEAADRTEALSGRIQTVARAFASSMCADNQNTITTLFKTPSRYAFDEREVYLQHSYWHTGESAGQLGAMVDASRLVPRVDETGIIQPCKLFRPCPVIWLKGCAAERHTSSALTLELRSPEVSRVVYTYARTGSVFRSETRLTSFRPLENGPTTVFVESDIVALRDVAAEEIERFELLDIGIRPDITADWQYGVLDAKGATVLEGAVDAIAAGTKPEVAVGPGSLAGFYPSVIGNLCVYSADASPKRVVFERLDSDRLARERMTFLLQPQAFVKGRLLKIRFAVELSPGGIDSPARLDTRRVILAEGVRKCRAGANGIYEGTLRAEWRRTVPLEFDEPAAGWTAIETVSGIRVVPGRYASVAVAGELKIKAGEPVLRTNRAVVIEPALYGKAGGLVRLHNPSGTRQTVRISSNPELSIPRFEAEFTLEAGESRWYKIEPAAE